MFGSYHLLLSVSYFSLGSFSLSPLFHTANLRIFSLARRDFTVRTHDFVPAGDVYNLSSLTSTPIPKTPSPLIHNR